MTENRPRHLKDETAIMPAIPSQPKHARPDTSELRAQRPPVPPPPPRASHKARKAPWWKRMWGVQ